MSPWTAPTPVRFARGHYRPGSARSTPMPRVGLHTVAKVPKTAQILKQPLHHGIADVGVPRMPIRRRPSSRRSCGQTRRWLRNSPIAEQSAGNVRAPTILLRDGRSPCQQCVNSKVPHSCEKPLFSYFRASAVQVPQRSGLSTPTPPTSYIPEIYVMTSLAYQRLVPAQPVPPPGQKYPGLINAFQISTTCCCVNG